MDKVLVYLFSDVSRLYMYSLLASIWHPPVIWSVVSVVPRIYRVFVNNGANR